MSATTWMLGGFVLLGLLNYWANKGEVERAEREEDESSSLDFSLLESELKFGMGADWDSRNESSSSMADSCFMAASLSEDLWHSSETHSAHLFENDGVTLARDSFPTSTDWGEHDWGSANDYGSSLSYSGCDDPLPSVNPATGLPIQDIGGMDTLGNGIGFDTFSSTSSSMYEDNW